MTGLGDPVLKKKKKKERFYMEGRKNGRNGKCVHKKVHDS